MAPKMPAVDPDEELPAWATAEVLVLGCGNPLMGDDGFGPAVAERLLNEGAGCRGPGAGSRTTNDDETGLEYLPGARHPAPGARHPAPDICVINIGTGSRGIMFNLVAGPVRPKAIIIVDALEAQKRPGELFWVNVEDLSIEKAEDFSLHMTPASNMLLDLKKAGVEIKILACQPKNLPEAMSERLSPEVAKAVGPAAEIVMEMAGALIPRKTERGTPE